MAREIKTLDELLLEEEDRTREQRERELAILDSPDRVAKREAKKKKEFDRGVRLGWWDEHGNPLQQPDDRDTDEDDEDTN